MPALLFLASLASLAVLLCPAPETAQAQTVMPDGIAFVGGPPVLQAGGATYRIDVQLTIRGANYSGNNFGVYFLSDDQGLVSIPWGTAAVSDDDGRASLNVTTGPGAGNVTLTAALLRPDGTVRASKVYRVVGFGNVTGIVTDAAGKGIPGATVTLYAINDSARGEKVPTAGNPATTAGRDAAVPGLYSFGNVPFGTYLIEAAVDGHAANVTCTVSHPAESADINIPGYVATTPTPSPSATPTPSPTATNVPASPTPSPSSTATKTPTGDETRQIVWIGAVALVLAALIIGIQLLRKSKK
ncbi:MAG TPA: carboxypeptidase-like regulatory domain-containing protein [Methanocella sp.]|nr:carboxypeptidase-like regulatory domain-containing protein [Methanocella sp.]